MALLEVNNLEISTRDGTKLVKGIDLSIEPGEMHGLIGESGSGKSLTALSIVRLLPAGLKVTSGGIRFGAEGDTLNIEDLKGEQILHYRGGKVGFIFQDPMTSLNPSMRCGEQVAEMIRAHKNTSKTAIREKVLKLFDKVKLPDPEKIFRAYPHEISGGQRQRVMIAMAISCEPQLLIADEATTALDVTVQKSVIELIDELRKSDGMAVLFITHDLGLIASIADRISIMYKGATVETGKTIDILNHSSHPYTKGLLACRPPLNKRIKRLPTVDEVVESDGKWVYETESEQNATSEDLMKVTALNLFYPGRKGFFGKGNDDFHALKDVGFEIKKGESLALVGESGSGKSTLGKALLRMIDTRSGKVMYKGQSLLEMTDREFGKMRKEMQFIFQDPFSSLNPKQRVGDIVSEPMKVHGLVQFPAERKKKVIELLLKVGLQESDLGKYPHQFSGGQRQRIVIARALSVEPEFIVCDEAVSALDVSVQATILNLLKDLKEEFGLTYLFITHDMSVVRFFCDRLLVMQEGRIIEEGETGKVFEKPDNDFTRKLIDSSF